MSCPVCDHTMQNLGTVDYRLWWCPRCGTLKEDLGYAAEQTTGKLPDASDS
jgi:Zn-finger nucleic acid-binding protein